MDLVIRNARVRGRAELVVVDAPSVHEALRLQPLRRHVIKDGQEVAQARLSRELRKRPSATDSRQL